MVRELFKDVGVKYLRLYIAATGQAMFTLDILGIPATLRLDRQGRDLGRPIGIAEWDGPEMVKFLEGVIEQTRGDRG